jgi:hypothetical protein
MIGRIRLRWLRSFSLDNHCGTVERLIAFGYHEGPTHGGEVTERRTLGRNQQWLDRSRILGVRLTTECQTEHEDEFPGRRSRAKKLPHRRV